MGGSMKYLFFIVTLFVLLQPVIAQGETSLEQQLQNKLDEADYIVSSTIDTCIEMFRKYPDSELLHEVLIENLDHDIRWRNFIQGQLDRLKEGL